MRFAMSNCESGVKMKFQLSEQEMLVLRKKGLIGNTPKVVRNKQVVSGGLLYVTNSRRTVEVAEKGFGWYEVSLERKSLFVMDCPNHAFLKSMKRLMELAIANPEHEPEEKPVYIRKVVKLKDGIPVHKTAIYKVDITASLLERDLPNIHKEFYEQQQKNNQKVSPAVVSKPSTEKTPASPNRLADLQRKFQKAFA